MVSKRTDAPRLGRYGCNAPGPLVDSALRHAREVGEGPAFVSFRERDGELPTKPGRRKFLLPRR